MDILRFLYWVAGGVKVIRAEGRGALRHLLPQPQHLHGPLRPWCEIKMQNCAEQHRRMACERLVF
jgi:hypothetical protein